MTIRPLLVLFLLSSFSLSFAQGIDDDFENKAVGETLPIETSTSLRQVLPDKDSEGLVGSAVVKKDSDGGHYLRLDKRQTFVQIDDPKSLWTIADGPVVFRMDFRINGKMPLDIMLHNGRTSAGFKIMIDSDKKTISISQGGGSSVSRAESSQFDLPNLKDGAWYTLEIRDVTLSEDRMSHVEGQLYLYEQGSPSRLLLDGVTVGSAGTWPFKEINTLIIRRWGSGDSSLDLDNIVLAGN